MFKKYFVTIIALLFIFVSPASAVLIAPPCPPSICPPPTPSALALSLNFLLIPTVTLAQDYFGTGYISNTNLPTQDVRATIINLINTILGVLALIVLVGILFGGFMVMTAGGDEKRAGQGRKVVGNFVIGLIIIFLAFAITNFVFDILTAAS